METLDVTKIEPRFKHPAIFGKFDALAGGQAFVIHNDHDPVPLYYQMIAERGKVFEWEYLKKGPEIFEVKITKLATGVTSSTIGEIVANDYRKVEVFRKYDIDFCCGGNKTLKEACEEKGLNISEVENALTEVEKTPIKKQQDFINWELDFLVDYILNTHHKYVSEAMPMLLEFSKKVAGVHGELHPEVIEIAKYFDAVAQELSMHMHKEERILFPLIKKIAVAKRSGLPLPESHCGSVEGPIGVMEAEHVSAGENLERIKELSNNYTPPQDACSSYRVLFSKLQEFELDLHEHIHLENNILFPKAIQMERELA